MEVIIIQRVFKFMRLYIIIKGLCLEEIQVFRFGNWWEAAKVIRRRQWYPLQYSCLENPMDGGAWWAAVHGVAKSQTRLNDFTFTFHYHALEKEMATHSSILAWRISVTEEPVGLPSLWRHRVGHDWRDIAAAAKVIKRHWLIKEEIKYWIQYPNNQVKLSSKRWAISLVR